MDAKVVEVEVCFLGVKSPAKHIEHLERRKGLRFVEISMHQCRRANLRFISYDTAEI